MKASYQQAQAAVLGAVLLGATIDRLTTEHGLAPIHFEAPHHTVFQAMVDLNDDQDPINDTTVIDRLERAGIADAAATVMRLSGPVPHLGSLDAFCKIIRRESAWQQRGRTLQHLADSIHDRHEDAFNAHATTLVAGDATANRSETTLTPEELGSEMIDWLNETEVDAIATPFPQLTELLLGGFRPGATTILGAWSHMGKTVLLDQLLAHAAGNGHRAHVYVNEMDRVTRVARQISRMTKVPVDRIIRKELRGDDHSKVLHAASSLPFGLTDCAGWSAEDIARHVRRHKWDFWGVDLVTRIPASDTRDWDRVSGILTDVALQTGTHGVLVCQLNQERNKSAIKPPPVARDLRNTGAWFNDASNVLFLHRDQDEDPDTGMVVVLEDGHVRVDKARAGRLGGVAVTFVPQRMSFDTLESYRMSVAA